MSCSSAYSLKDSAWEIWRNVRGLISGREGMSERGTVGMSGDEMERGAAEVGWLRGLIGSGGASEKVGLRGEDNER